MTDRTRITVGLPTDLHNRVQADKDRDRCSLSDVVVGIVARHYERIERGTPGVEDNTGTQGRTSTRRFPRTPAT